jgi:hypothetical protein
MLGQEEEEWLYDDFYIYGQQQNGEQYNNCSILNNCLLSVIGNAIKNEEVLSSLPVLDNDQRIRTTHLKKKEAERDWKQMFSSISANILNGKLTSGKTVIEQYNFDRKNKLRLPIDELEFEHRMNNLARTAYEDKLKKEPSFAGHEIEYRISLRKVIETLAGKPYKKLSTYEIKKTTKMLFENRNKEFTFFEKTTDGQLEVIYGKLYDYKEYPLLQGGTDISINFNLSGQDFRNNKNYIYSDNRDFEICEQKKNEFWEFIEAEKKDAPNIKKIGARLNRVKNNKVFQAAPIKLLSFMKLNFHPKHPISLNTETFDMLFGDIRHEAQSESLAGKNRPALEQSIIRVVRWMVLWIAKAAGWVYSAKVANGKVIIVPKRSYFEKWQGAKNLPENATKT